MAEIKPLKIAFDAKRLFHNREGLGAYARTLVADLRRLYPQHDYYLCTPKLSSHHYAQEFLDKDMYYHITAPSYLPGGWWRSRGMLKELRQSGIDIYWGLSNELPFGLSKVGIKSVVTIHDMIYRTFPQQFSWADRKIYNLKFSNAIKQGEVIMATSQSTKQDILQFFPSAKGKIEVVYQSVGKLYTSPKQTNPKQTKPIKTGDYYIMVGTINERKNLRMVIEAYRLLRNRERKKVLVIGRGKGYKVSMQSLISQYKLEDYFRFETDVSNEALRDYYKSALGLLFPSYYEGFGRPIVEALGAGIAVIGHKVSSIPELIGKYGIIIEYNNIESLKEAIIKTNHQNKTEDAADNGLAEHLMQFDSELLSHKIMGILRHDK